MPQHLHIITFSIPYPANYGGVIDSYFRIKALHDNNIKIHLHCFEYNRKPAPELLASCETISYYKRKKGLRWHFSFIPYIVITRKSNELLHNLLNDNYPILFDGLHTTAFINHPALKNRKKIVRAHNIEHKYYDSMTKIETNILKKIYFKIEAIKLKWYEKILHHTNFILSISKTDQTYFNNKYKNAILVTAFHPFNQVKNRTGTGEYILYHGDLSVNENFFIVQFLIKNVFSKVPYKCIIAGKNPSSKLTKLITQYSNIQIIANPSDEEMQLLISNAHINLLPVLKNNGLKLKLLFALYTGRYCIVNKLMAEGTTIDNVCHIANTPDEMIKTINEIINKPFTEEMIIKRSKVLNQHYNNLTNAEIIKNLL